MSSQQSVSDSNNFTGKLCNWAFEIELSQVPDTIQSRAKLILLDGIGCGLIGAHLPWSEWAAKAIFDLEPPGSCSLLGWGNKLSASSAALLNSTFIQAFELDDWHPHAPIHSAALLIPALLAATQHVSQIEGQVVTGQTFLLAFIVGLEIGPRIGLGLGGAKMLSRGWHSGAVFGGPAVAVAVSKLLGSSPRQMEWALGTACTQAGGLMSAQFESMAKRMQHGFAARNGVLAAFLARADYTGIERVLERPYGGFFTTFAPSTQSLSAADTASPFASLGENWEVENILIKPYALMAALHAPVDCAKLLQKSHGALLQDSERIESIKIEMGEEALKKGGWKLETDEVEATAAQMNASYAVAMQLVDGDVALASFAPDKLNRKEIHSLIRKTVCVRQENFDRSLKTRITISFADNIEDAVESVEMPRGVQPKMSNDEIEDKWESLVTGLLDEDRRRWILNLVMAVDKLSTVDALIKELGKDVGCILE